MGPRLVLWDIDHTLIESGDVGLHVYAEAFAEVTGHPLDTMPQLPGRTEPVIFREALRSNGVRDHPGLYRQFAAAQAHGYESHLDDLRRHGRALPGAADALRALADHADIRQSVLTGNTRPTAEIKLSAFGLAGLVDLEIGAYGTDDDNRANLVAIARQRASKAHAQDYPPRQTIIIGDTTSDVAAALASGARIIAVATGREPAAALAVAGAATVLADLTSTSVLLAAIRQAGALPSAKRLRRLGVSRRPRPALAQNRSPPVRT